MLDDKFRLLDGLGNILQTGSSCFSVYKEEKTVVSFEGTSDYLVEDNQEEMFEFSLSDDLSLEGVFPHFPEPKRYRLNMKGDYFTMSCNGEKMVSFSENKIKYSMFVLCLSMAVFGSIATLLLLELIQ